MKLIIVFTTILFFISCSSKQVELDITEAKKSVLAPQSFKELLKRKREILNNSKNLSQEQKERLLNLQEHTLGGIDDSNTEIRKYKIILFKHLAENKYDEKKVKVLKRRIKGYHDRKLSLMFTAIDEAKNILGVDFKNYQDDIVDRAMRLD